MQTHLVLHEEIDSTTAALDGGTCSSAEQYELCVKRSSAYLVLGDRISCMRAIDDAKRCLDLDNSDPRGYRLLGQAQMAAGERDNAVATFKKGLEAHPEDQELKEALHRARLAVLEDLFVREEGALPTLEYHQTDTISNHGNLGLQYQVDGRDHRDERENSEWEESYASDSANIEREPGESAPPPSRARPPASRQVTEPDAFLSRMEQLLDELTIDKVLRRALYHLAMELIKLRTVVWGAVLLLAGALCHALAHHNKVMFASILFVCLYRSSLYSYMVKSLNEWSHSSGNRVASVAWVPMTLYLLPICIRCYGHFRFFLFLSQDSVLSLLVAVSACGIVIGVKWERLHRLWGTGKRLKLVCYGVALLYWVILRGHWGDILRLLAPALMDIGGILLGSLTAEEAQRVCTRALGHLMDELTGDPSIREQLDVWFLVGFMAWFIDYWQQPTNISIQMLYQMLVETMESLQKSACYVFSPELNTLRSQVEHLRQSDDFNVLIHFFKQSLDMLCPPRSVAWVGLFLKKCPSYIAFTAMTVFYGKLPLPLIAFLIIEFEYLSLFYDRAAYQLDQADSMEILLLGSPFLRIWKNFKTSVQCLEASRTLAKVVETGTSIVATASRVPRIARVLASIHQQGILAADAEDIAEALKDLASVAQDSSAIFDEMKRIASSDGWIHLQQYVVSWWASNPN